MTALLPDLIDTVQTNCLIADARHAREMTMCTFLLEMREYFRWEQELPFSARLPRDELGDWMNAREHLWDTVEHEDFRPLPLGGSGIDPFDADAVNAALLPFGLVYSSGIGQFRKPHFVLAELREAATRDGVRVLVAGCEYARDLIAPPAVMRDGAIFLRTDAIRRFLWTKYEEWSYKERDSALGRAFAAYGVEDDLDAGLDRMMEGETEAMILHEVGEARAEPLLGTEWPALLGRLSTRHAEVLLRAVRDHLADALVTLPTLIEREAIGALHFYMANLSGQRRALYPALVEAYARWLQDGRLEGLAACVARGQAHWQAVAARIVEESRHREDMDGWLKSAATGDLAGLRC